jgi:hypothetical protein
MRSHRGAIVRIVHLTWICVAVDQYIIDHKKFDLFVGNILRGQPRVHIAHLLVTVIFKTKRSCDEYEPLF